MKLIRIILFSFLAALLSATHAFADTAISWYPAVISGGYNTYSPFVFYDAQAGIYKMYYGGSYVSGQQDNIYYATSSDSISWGAYSTILTPATLQTKYYNFTGQTINVAEVNDPSVTKHWNTSNGQYQYTMFFTVCMAPCSQANNFIWSMTSLDGVNFDFPVPLTVPGEGNTIWTGQPSAVFDMSGPSGTFWHVYYENRNSSTGSRSVYMSYVNGYRQAIGSSSTVYTDPGTGGDVTAVSVVPRGSNWDLLYNVFMPNQITNVYRITSSSNTSWSGTPVPVIQNNGQPYCATLTPTSMAISDSQYVLYTSLIQRTYDGSGNPVCDFWHNESISRFVINIP